jgi:hypothetical protein
MDASPMTYSMPGSAFGGPADAPHAGVPLVLLFERDDTLAVPVLSQLRLAGYDVRAARTPVELFDAAQKHTVALIVVDLGNAAASRREFWVALDAQRRGRAIQVLTFRVVTPGIPPETDLDAAPHALADLEVGGPHDMMPLVDAVRQRVPMSAGTAGGGSMPGTMGAAGGMGLRDAPRPGVAPSSPFAHPAAGNPFAAADAPSPFDQPDSSNPFAQTLPPAPSAPWGAPPGNPYAPPYVAPYPPPYDPVLASFGVPAPDHAPPFMPSPAMPSPAMPPGFPPMPGSGQFAACTSQPGMFGPPNDTGFAAPWDLPGSTSQPGGMFGASPPRPTSAPGPAPVLDAWLPPDGAALPTNPQVPAVPPVASSPQRPGGQAAEPRAEGLNGSLHLAHAGEASHFPSGPAYTNEVELDASSARDRDAFSGEWSQAERSTAPAPAWMPPPSDVPPPYPNGNAHDASGGLTLPEERALSTVLVEGSLLSPEQLAVLKDIRRILNGVEVEYKLGELALLFRFLSPDQLLAALLVSRQLITPEQIAALGRIKQEMAASGMNYDLETLLVMFHILSREDLDRLRAELA